MGKKEKMEEREEKNAFTNHTISEGEQISKI